MVPLLGACPCSYFLAAQDVKEGDVLHSGPDAPIRPGKPPTLVVAGARSCSGLSKQSCPPACSGGKLRRVHLVFRPVRAADQSASCAALPAGNTLPLSDIPVGMAVHNVELRPGAGGQLARAAGASCTLVKKGGYWQGLAYRSAAWCEQLGAVMLTRQPAHNTMSVVPALCSLAGRENMLALPCVPGFVLLF